MTSSPKPSYVNISCSVNGYTSFSCYNSSARENLHSHKSNPSLSPCWNGVGEINAVRKSSLELQSENYKSYFQNDSSQTLAGTTETDCAFLNKSLNSNGENESIMSASNFQEPSTMESKLIPSNCRTDRPSTSEPSKSLVQQRIERLYGPAAIVEGIFLHKAKVARNVNNRDIHSPEESACVASSVYISTLNPGNKLTAKLSPKAIKKELVESSNFKDRPRNTIESSSIEETRQVQRTSVHLNGFQNSAAFNDRKPWNENKDAVPNVDEVKCPETAVANKIEAKGVYFLQVMNKEKTKIQSLISHAEKKLSEESLSEDAAGKFRATIGKASLLLNQKFQQFQDLCNKNISQKPNDPLPTTASDLEGFWDLVLIQVDHIYDMFYDIGILTNKEGFKAVKPLDESVGVRPKQTSRKTRIASKSSGIKQSSKKEEAALAREEARKKLAEIKRQARKQMAEQNSQQTVEIFIPDSKD